MIRWPGSVGITLVLTVCCHFFADRLFAQEIKIKTENGILVVYNPKEPVPIKGQPAMLTLKEDFTIGRDPARI